MDLGTGLTVLGASLGGKDIIVKMLGPTADYIGSEVKTFTEKRVKNIQNIFANTKKKLGSKIEEKGAIPPKVLQGTLNEGSFADDFLSVEYFGGVLASSRTGISRDDRGAFFNALVSRMSTYQMRMHYVFYHALKRTFDGENINWGLDSERNKLQLFIPFETFARALDFTNDEVTKFSVLLDHIINGLLREQLIDTTFRYGNLEVIKPLFPEAPEGGIILQPNLLGFELFFWAYGLGQDNPKTFLKSDVKFDLDEKVVLDKGFRRVI